MPVICKCHNPPFSFFNYEITELGEDIHGAEVSLQRCKLCSQVWLKYLVEEPHLSRSGRWWRVAVSQVQLGSDFRNIARELIQQQMQCFVGGSFFNSTGKVSDAPIVIN
jgi:hypothetical protein